MQELYTKQDLLNALGEYIEVLTTDIKNATQSKDTQTIIVLSNVRFSLEEMLNTFRG